MNLITVVVTTYNRDHYLEKCIKSILNQTYKKFDLIIVSDGYFDSTQNIVNQFNDERIKLIFNEHTGLPSKSRNIGILNAKSKFIAFCDDDDIWYQEKLELQLSIIIQNENLLIHTSANIISKDDLLIQKSIYRNLIKKFYSLTKYNLWLTNYITLSSIILKTELAKKISFDEAVKLAGSEDYKFLLEFTRNNKLFYINKPLVGYRIHNNNISANRLKGYERSIEILRDLSINRSFLIKFIAILGIFLYQLRIYLIKIK